MLGRMEIDGSLEVTRLGCEDGALLGSIDGIAETDGAILVTDPPGTFKKRATAKALAPSPLRREDVPPPFSGFRIPQPMTILISAPLGKPRICFTLKVSLPSIGHVSYPIAAILTIKFWAANPALLWTTIRMSLKRACL